MVQMNMGNTWKQSSQFFYLVSSVSVSMIVSMTEGSELFEPHVSKLTSPAFILYYFFLQIDQPDQKTLANLPWIVEPGQETKRGISTKYETTIF